MKEGEGEEGRTAAAAQNGNLFYGFLGWRESLPSFTSPTKKDKDESFIYGGGGGTIVLPFVSKSGALPHNSNIADHAHIVFSPILIGRVKSALSACGKPEYRDLCLFCFGKFSRGGGSLREVVLHSGGAYEYANRLDRAERKRKIFGREEKE